MARITGCGGVGFEREKTEGTENAGVQPRMDIPFGERYIYRNKADGW